MLLLHPRGWMPDSEPRRVERACRRHMLVLVEVEEPPRKPGEMPQIGLRCPGGHEVRGRADWLEVFVVPEGLVPVSEPKFIGGAAPLVGRTADGFASYVERRNQRLAEARELGVKITLAATHCRRGHPWDQKNTRWRIEDTGSRVRICRTCHLFASRRAEAKKRANKLARRAA